jgi:glutamine synthetase
VQAEKILNSIAVENVIERLHKLEIKWVRLNFCDPFGFLQQITVNSNQITQSAFTDGIPRLDGSSICYTICSKKSMNLICYSSLIHLLLPYCQSILIKIIITVRTTITTIPFIDQALQPECL